MSVWGIGGKWLLWSLFASTPIIVCAYIFCDALTITSVSPWWFYGTGISILLIGIPFWLLSAITVKRAFESETFCTSGVFAICRNPIYAAWILFLMPGSLLFTRNPLLLTIPFIMYAVLRVVLPREEAWLEERYGAVYRDYKMTVPRILLTCRFIFSKSDTNQEKVSRS